jgi:DNA-nicking Smr family endonuclease
MIASRRRVSEAERALWRAAIGDARPLGDKSLPPPPVEPLSAAAAPPSPVEPAPPSRHHQDRAATLDRRTAEKLKRGQLPIEARLDLHGMTQAAAQSALARFVERMAVAGRRTLLVITGKGIRPSREGAEPGEPPIGILRRQVPRWLQEPPLRGHILAVREAAPEHGGGGALYVLLRRQRAPLGVP